MFRHGTQNILMLSFYTAKGVGSIGEGDNDNKKKIGEA
jgi:hypothetical protein